MSYCSLFSSQRHTEDNFTYKHFFYQGNLKHCGEWSGRFGKKKNFVSISNHIILSDNLNIYEGHAGPINELQGMGGGACSEQENKHCV